jgi:hypothetical protein
MTKHLKNLYEDLIEQMMMEEVAGLDKDILETLQNVSIEKQRMAILSILDKDRRLFMDIKKIVEKTPISASEHIKDVVQLLRKYVEVGDVEKKRFGEIMTPIFLVENMINLLPDEVWSDPNLKWLDPCAGVGVFFSVVISRLMNGLSEWEPDEEKRYKHIVENMLHSCELQAKNLFLNLVLYDSRDEYAMNVYCGSFLDEGFDKHAKDVWGVEKFDVILQNPPYNSNGTGNGNILWNKFIEKSIDILQPNKYLVAVHPSLWRKPQSKKGVCKKVSDLIKQKQLNYLEIHSIKDGLKFFNAGTRFDFYLLQNCAPYKPTIIKDEEGIITKEYINDWQLIPNSNFEKIKKILGSGTEVVFNSASYEVKAKHTNEYKTDFFKFPLVHSTPKTGVRYRYSSRNDKGMFGISKIIFGDSGINDVVVDLKGEFGMTQHSIGIKINESDNIQKIVCVLKSDEFKKVVSSCMWSNFQIDWMFFTCLKKDFWKEFID